MYRPGTKAVVAGHLSHLPYHPQAPRRWSPPLSVRATVPQAGVQQNCNFFPTPWPKKTSASPVLISWPARWCQLHICISTTLLVQKQEIHDLFPPHVKKLLEKLPWPGKDVGHQKCYCIFSLIYLISLISSHQRNPRDSAPGNAHNLQPQNLNLS